MTYRRFELMSLGVGGLAIGVTVLISAMNDADLVEIAAQSLLFAVLLGAIHWGRAGGLLTALGATLAYVIMRTPAVMASGMTQDLLRLILLRVVAYGLVGILGGELCSRTKYLLARLREDGSFDAESRVFNQRLVCRLITTALGSYQRYGTPFSILIIELAPGLAGGPVHSHGKSLPRVIADHIRNDIRLVDDVGRLEDGRFLVLLPSTPRGGAEIACVRITQGLRDIVRQGQDSVRATVMGTPEDAQAIGALCHDLGGIVPAAEPA